LSAWKKSSLWMGMLVLLGMLGFAGVANAATGTTMSNGWPVNVRSQPNLSASVVRTLPDRTTVNIICQVHGPVVASIYGVRSDLWDKLAENQWVSDSMINTGTAGAVAPDCGAATPPTGVRGAPNGTEERAAQYVEGKIAVGSMEHIGWCDMASALAHGDGASGYYTAVAHASAFTKAGLMNTDRNPPRGALVFFVATPRNGNAGHVAISLGNGRIGTTSSIGYKNVDLVTLESWTGAYSGWSYYKPSAQLGNTPNG
jgi:hypothetical protein